MKSIVALTIICTSLFSLTGCGEEKPRTMQYYLDNPSEIKAVQAKCQAENDKGFKSEGVLKENCATARKATSRIIRNNIQ